MNCSGKRFAFSIAAMVMGSTLAAFASVPGAAPHPTALLGYADPGSGALLWQILVTTGLMASFYLGRASRWLKSLLSPAKGNPAETSPAGNPSAGGQS